MTDQADPDVLKNVTLPVRFVRADGAGRERTGTVLAVVGGHLTIQAERRPPKGAQLEIDITLGPGLGRLKTRGTVLPGRKRSLAGDGPSIFEVEFERTPAIDTQLAGFAEADRDGLELDGQGRFVWPLGEGNWRVGEESDGRSLCGWLGERWVGAKAMFGGVTTDIGHLGSRAGHMARIHELSERIHVSAAEVVPLIYQKLILAPGAGVPRAEMPDAPEVGGVRRTDERWLDVIAAQMRVIDAFETVEWKLDRIDERRVAEIEMSRRDLSKARQLMEDKAESDGAVLTWIKQARAELAQLDLFVERVVLSASCTPASEAPAAPARESSPTRAATPARISESAPVQTRSKPVAVVPPRPEAPQRVVAVRAEPVRRVKAPVAAGEQGHAVEQQLAEASSGPRGMPATRLKARVPRTARRGQAQSPESPAPRDGATGDPRDLQAMVDAIAKDSRRRPVSEEGSPRSASSTRKDGSKHSRPGQASRPPSGGKDRSGRASRKSSAVEVRRAHAQQPSMVLVVGLAIAVLAFAGHSWLGGGVVTSSAAVDLGSLSQHLPLEGFRSEGSEVVLTVTAEWGGTDRNKRWTGLVEACAVLADAGRESAVIQDAAGRALATWQNGSMQLL